MCVTFRLLVRQLGIVDSEFPGNSLWVGRVLLSILYALTPPCWPMFKPPSSGVALSKLVVGLGKAPFPTLRHFTYLLRDPPQFPLRARLDGRGRPLRLELQLRVWA